MIIAGIDYSINSPSVCVYNSEKELNPFNVSWYLNVNGYSQKEIIRVQDKNFMKPLDVNIQFQKDYKTNIERYNNLAKWVSEILIDNKVEEVCLEDYSLGAKGLVFNIAECTGILKLTAFENNSIRYTTLPPTTNKKMFSGKGNSNKDRMIQTFNELYKIDISELFGKSNYTGSPVSDIVDSFSLISSYLTLNNNHQ